MDSTSEILPATSFPLNMLRKAYNIDTFILDYGSEISNRELINKEIVEHFEKVFKERRSP
jgi:hypothetical protein